MKIKLGIIYESIVEEMTKMTMAQLNFKLLF